MIARRVQLGCAAAASLLLGLVAAPATVSAHALAQSSVPAEGATLPTAPREVVITFGEEPDPTLSTITVVDTAGRSWTAGPAAPLAGNALQLRVGLRPLPSGVYTVTWKTVSALDGHLAAGAFAFGVGVSPGAAVPRAAGYGAAAPSVAAVISRLLLYAGIVTVFGAVLLGALVFGVVPALLRRLIAGASLVAWLGAGGVVLSQLSGAGVSLGSALASTLGRAALAREVTALALVAAGALLLRTARIRVLATVAATLALAAMVVDVLFSHAAAQPPAALNEVAQLLHIIAVAVWIGGLAALLVILVRAPDGRRPLAARRLSTMAAAGLLVVAATGVFRAVLEVQTWANLFTTAFGLLVIVKAASIIILAGLGALNRWGHLPRLPAFTRRLRRTVSIELVVAAGALTVAAALVNIAPPWSSAAAAPGAAAPLVVSGTDFGTSVKLTLTVGPARAGVDDFRLDVRDYDSGAPVDATRVSVAFSLPGQSVIAGSTLQFARTAPGVYQARGANLAVDGTWNLVALVERGAQSVEIPLQLTTRATAPVVVRTAFAGSPALYTVQLAGGGAVQVYIDPDRAGPVEFHMTFLDSRQQEFAISSAAAIEVDAGGRDQDLAVRRLDSTGHFVADATVGRQATRFRMLASTLSGDVFSTYVDITPAS